MDPAKGTGAAGFLSDRAAPALLREQCPDRGLDVAHPRVAGAEPETDEAGVGGQDDNHGAGPSSGMTSTSGNSSCGQLGRCNTGGAPVVVNDPHGHWFSARPSDARICCIWDFRQQSGSIVTPVRRSASRRDCSIRSVTLRPSSYGTPAAQRPALAVELAVAVEQVPVVRVRELDSPRAVNIGAGHWNSRGAPRVRRGASDWTGRAPRTGSPAGTRVLPPTTTPPAGHARRCSAPHRSTGSR